MKPAKPGEVKAVNAAIAERACNVVAAIAFLGGIMVGIGAALVIEPVEAQPEARAAPAAFREARYKIVADISGCTPPADQRITSAVALTIVEPEPGARFVLGCTRFATSWVPTARVITPKR